MTDASMASPGVDVDDGDVGLVATVLDVWTASVVGEVATLDSPALARR